MYLTPPLKGFPLEFCIDAGVSKNKSDGAFRWSKRFSDRFSRFDTILECDGHPATQPRCRSYYALCCRAERKNRLGVRRSPKNREDAGAPRLLDRGVTDHLLSHMSYRTKFCRCRSSRFGVGRASQFFKDAGARPIGMCACLSQPVLPCQISSFYVKPFERSYGNLPENFNPYDPPFKVTQGHCNRHGLIGYL